MSTQHLVLTRFNLVFTSNKVFARDRQGNPTQTPAWLEHRFALFEKYCLPSLKHQTVRDFSWLVFFDVNTPAWARERIQAHAVAFPGLKPLFLGPVESDADLQAACRQFISADTKTLITTRLDNDDAFHDSALETLQRNVGSKPRQLLSFRYGYNMVNGEAMVVRHLRNPFLSLVERQGKRDFLTVFCGLPHGKLSKIAPVKTITDKPYWLQVIHERNISNRDARRPGPPDCKSARDLFKRFKHRVLKPLSRLFWPASFKRTYQASELQPLFHFEL